MFGYIKPYKPEMKIKEFQVFSAYYCGLCKELGRHYNQISRFSLNYEFTFLAIFLSSLSEEKINMSLETCIANPIKKKPVINKNPFLLYAADMNIILLYYKLQDIKHDSNYFSGSLLALLFHNAYKKTKAKYEDKVNKIEKHLSELAELESSKCDKIDIVAEPFANIMKEIFLYPDLDLPESELRYICDIAYHLGRFIYIIDAYDDIEKDIKSKSYNPILCQFRFNGEKTEDFKKRVNDWVEFNLTFTLSQINQYLDKLSFRKNEEIIKNILQLGLMIELNSIMKGGKKCEIPMKF